MSEFYSDWKKARDCQECDLQFVKAFLSKEDKTFSFMDSSFTREQFEDLLRLLQSIPTEYLLDCICDIKETNQYDTSEIPQFSDFEKGAIIVPRILEFYPNGINYTELGKKLIGAKENEANRKYGENHASLAALMSLATISKKQRKLVFPTGLGHFLIDYHMDEKNRLLKAMMLRNSFLQAMVRAAVCNCGSYGSLMCDLAKTTAKRRRQSVRHLMEFILKDTEAEVKYCAIDWTV